MILVRLGIHTQKPTHPRVVDAHAVVLLAAGHALHLIIILLAIKAIPIPAARCGVAALGHYYPEGIIILRLKHYGCVAGHECRVGTGYRHFPVAYYS